MATKILSMLSTLHYDDDVTAGLIETPPSIFLAGPTARGVLRTPWRAEALALLERAGFAGVVVLPEFRDEPFEVAAPGTFGSGRASPVPGMRERNYGVLRWETAGIERVTVVLFWMPFCVRAADDPTSLPGFTTRAEVGRELARDPSRVVLGMPRGAISAGHILYHAHAADVIVHETLADTVRAAIEAVTRAVTSGDRS
jgi:hypothetical protein